MKLNLDQLRAEIRAMSSRSNLYKLLKEELSALGFWRCKARGNPSAGYSAMKRKIQGENVI